MKTYAEQVNDLKATRKARAEEMKKFADAAVARGESMNAAEQQGFDTAEAEIKALDADIARFEKLAKMQADEAQPVETVEKTQAVATQGTSSLTLKHQEELEPGIAFARLARVKHAAEKGLIGGLRDTVQVAHKLYPNDPQLVKSLEFERAAVAAANTGSPTWAGNLITDGGVAFADFIEFLRPRSLVGQVEGLLRRLPFDVPVLLQNSGGQGYWTKEGNAKPVTSWTYSQTKMTPLKVTALAAATNEMLARATPAADALLRDELARAVNSRIDGTFASNAAAVTDESPAGLINGVGETNLTGDGTVFGIRCDIATMMKALVSNNLSVAGSFWIMPETVAIDLSLATNEVGVAAFPGMTPTGGTLAGLPVITSQYVPVTSSGPVVALVRGDEIYLGDEGGLLVKTSDQASILMADNPNMNSTTPTAAQSVSMWQTNSTAFLVERFINWKKRRNEAVVWAAVNWAACGSIS